MKGGFTHIRGRDWPVPQDARWRNMAYRLRQSNPNDPADPLRLDLADQLALATLIERYQDLFSATVRERNALIKEMNAQP